MNPWIIISLAAAGAVLALDLLLRRKGWNRNTKQEKISLLVNMLSAGPYVFLSFLGMLWGIAGGNPETALGTLIYDATLFLGSIYFIIAIAATLGSLILRKKGKTKASIWVNVIALLYIAIVLGLNYLVSGLM